MLPSNVKFITGRNVRMGKPGLYVKDSGRILAIGGSRAQPMSPIYPYVTPSHTIKVLGVPALVKKPGDGFKVSHLNVLGPYSQCNYFYENTANFGESLDQVSLFKNNSEIGFIGG